MNLKQKVHLVFDNGIGAINGIFLWMMRQSKQECKKVNIGPKKFLCGRKHKFALNLQACCVLQRKETVH
jgi:hypothetical protein